MKRHLWTVLLLLFALIMSGCGQAAKQAKTYTLSAVHEVNGRQGVCVEGDSYWVSGSTTLTKYDSDWNIVTENNDPFKGFALEVNHMIRRIRWILPSSAAA